MNRSFNHRTERDLWRDYVIATKHPRYRDRRPIEALRRVRADRGEYV